MEVCFQATFGVVYLNQGNCGQAGMQKNAIAVLVWTSKSEKIVFNLNLK